VIIPFLIRISSHSVVLPECSYVVPELCISEVYFNYRSFKLMLSFPTNRRWAGALT
jgi:hypothetical protein